MTETDQYLFHCFPSRVEKLDDCGWGPADPAYCVAGLEILDLILSHGLLLTPEEIAIPRHPGAEQQNEPPIAIPQTRASFTLASLATLRRQNPLYHRAMSHLDLFGIFSIGLDPVAARDFDMAPVHYFYFDPDTSGRSASLTFPLVASLVHSLVEMREILSILTRLEERAVVQGGKSSPEYDHLRSQFDRARIGIQFQPEKRAEKLRAAMSAITVDQIEAALRTIDTDRRSLPDLVQALDLLCGLLQTADSHSKRAKLAYFSQHEWRVTKVLKESVAGFSLVESEPNDPPELAEKRIQMIRSIARIAGLLGRSVDERWLSSSWVLVGTAHNKKRIRDYVRLITCPAACAHSVKQLLRHRLDGRSDPPEVIAI